MRYQNVWFVSACALAVTALSSPVPALAEYLSAPDDAPPPLESVDAAAPPAPKNDPSFANPLGKKLYLPSSPYVQQRQLQRTNPGKSVPHSRYSYPQQNEQTLPDQRASTLPPAQPVISAPQRAKSRPSHVAQPPKHEEPASLLPPLNDLTQEKAPPPPPKLSRGDAFPALQPEWDDAAKATHSRPRALLNDSRPRDVTPDARDPHKRKPSPASRRAAIASPPPVAEDLLIQAAPAIASDRPVSPLPPAEDKRFKPLYPERLATGPRPRKAVEDYPASRLPAPERLVEDQPRRAVPVAPATLPAPAAAPVAVAASAPPPAPAEPAPARVADAWASDEGDYDEGYSWVFPSSAPPAQKTQMAKAPEAPQPMASLPAPAPAPQATSGWVFPEQHATIAAAAPAAVAPAIPAAPVAPVVVQQPAPQQVAAMVPATPVVPVTPVVPTVPYTPPPAGLSAESREILNYIPDAIDAPRPFPQGGVDISRVDPDIDVLLNRDADEVSEHEEVGMSLAVRKPGYDVNKALEEAYQHLLAGHPEVAISLYKEVLEADPKNQLGLFGLATTYHRLGNLAQARPIYGQLLKINPTHREALNNFMVLISEESPQEALQQLMTLYQRNPDFSPIPAQIAIIYQQLGNADGARRYMMEALRLSPENLTYRYNLAVLLDKQKHYAEAAGIYKSLLKSADRGQALPAEVSAIQERLIYIQTYYLNRKAG